MTPTPCVPCVPLVQSVNIPGLTGPPGLPGSVATFACGSPTGTTSQSAVMMGLGASPGASITPSLTGRVLILVTGVIGNGTASDGATAQIYYGSGTAPANSVAVASTTGVAAGSAKTVVNPSGTPGKIGFALAYLVTGLALSTAYWIDVALAAVTGGAANIYNVDIVAIEL